MQYITPECSDCSNAIQRNWWGGYRAQCYGCTCRAIARSLDAFSVLDSKQRKDAERLNWIEHQHLEELSMALVVDRQHDGQYYVCGDSNKAGYGATLRAAIDAAMAGA